MARTVNTQDRLADALRVLLPLAIHDTPEWLPNRDVMARNVAYAMAFAALAEYDEGEGDASSTERQRATLHLALAA